jgi:pulcherriminic acid synthase
MGHPVTASTSIAPDPFSPEFERDPYPLYKEMRDHHPVLWHEGAQAYFVSRYDDVARVYRETGTTFSPQPYDESLTPVWGPTLMHMSGNHHAGLRRIMTPMLRGNLLESYLVPILEDIGARLIDDFRDDGTVELVSQFARLYPIRVVLAAEGLPESDVDKISVWYNAAMDFFENVLNDPDIRDAGLRAAKDIEVYVKAKMQERRKNPGNDWISRLCGAEIAGQPVSDDEIRGFIVLLWSAGGETSDKAISSLFRNLLDHPDTLREVQRDRSLLTNAFVETLRYTNPTRMNPRRAMRDVELSGVVIPEGALILSMIGSANRDERQFGNPDVFDIHRDDLNLRLAFDAGAEHLGFGPGAHHCLGSWLAKREIEVAANLLLDAMPDLRYRSGFRSEETGVVMRGPRSLELEFTPTTQTGRD